MSSFFVSDVESSSAEDDDFFDEHPNSVFQYIEEYDVSESESVSSEASIKVEVAPSKKSFFLQEPESEEEEEGTVIYHWHGNHGKSAIRSQMSQEEMDTFL